MNTLMSFLSIVLLAPSVVAQDAPIPQDLPSQLRQTSDAVRRRVEQPIPRNLPLQPSAKRWDESFLNRLRANKRQLLATEGKVNASAEDRIAALEAKVEALESELEAQKALIKQLQELLDRLQKKN